jgi:L-lactate permease
LYNMPADMAGRAALFGAFTGLLPIGWIVLNIIFLHQLTEQNGSFKVLQDSLSGITEDRRIQLLLIAFSFGAFFEGAAGFGTPVAVTAAILIGLGFSPLAASGLSLIANTAPVAFGALGTPVITLAKVHGYDLMEVTAMIGRQLPFFSVLVPFWLIWAFAGRKAMWRSGPPFWWPVCPSPFRSTWCPTSWAPSWWTSSPRWSPWPAWWASCVWNPRRSGPRPPSAARTSAPRKPSRPSPACSTARAR